MKKTRDTNTEQTILKAAEELFLARGFALTSTTEIAARAGCNQALVHYYFRSKNKLFEAVFEQKFKLFFSNLTGVTSENLPFQHRIARLIETHFDILKANPRLPFLLINEFITNPKRIQTMKEKIGNEQRALFSLLEAQLSAEIAGGNIRPVRVVDLVMNIVALNAATFLAAPILDVVAPMPARELQSYLAGRKQENVRMILKSLQL